MNTHTANHDYGRCQLVLFADQITDIGNEMTV